ncbi:MULTISPECIES: hypothetical protein [Pseudonocardia]|uniref:Uncharacterized protein n=2 Tax=Pseudonocardia TaxID=1847 RepID=A0A1Y2N2S5_PSEAH|nr:MULTISPECIES: hypothetical protein [Pseudonocardia]OSY41752.1 hypothetical protein BG845_01780 [Pseudonocardia autotrophica]TDN71196.1 hypothetical protein C8E95_0223 [Pseudonocardia autotrophica]BBG01866.1 hypothetical protein Pdca_30750 [Pseudonocardia autotrophica]GEC23032.1 hypothetical protein PSA01_00610 [Pseudonocardia saturnea]
MSTLAVARPTTDPVPPFVVAGSVALWLGAILAGVAESLVRLAGPIPPTLGELAARSAIYLVLAVLVVQLRTGREAVRWTVVAVLGVVGLWSLIAEPVQALLGETTVIGFLVTASGPELLAAALRTLHVLEVIGALVLLFHPASNEFFRSGRVARPGPVR